MKSSCIFIYRKCNEIVMTFVGHKQPNTRAMKMKNNKMKWNTEKRWKILCRRESLKISPLETYETF